jgi:hypothetical protein
VTGVATSDAPFAGERSVGFVVGQLAARGIVNLEEVECVAAHPLNAASTNQRTLPGGRVAVSVVLAVSPISLASPPSIEAKTRYSIAFATAVHENVTGEGTDAPFAGATIVGESLLQRAPVSTTLKIAFDEETGVQALKIASTYHV